MAKASGWPGRPSRDKYASVQTVARSGQGEPRVHQQAATTRCDGCRDADAGAPAGSSSGRLRSPLPSLYHQISLSTSEQSHAGNSSGSALLHALNSSQWTTSRTLSMGMSATHMHGLPMQGVHMQPRVCTRYAHARTCTAAKTASAPGLPDIRAEPEPLPRQRQHQPRHLARWEGKVSGVHRPRKRRAHDQLRLRTHCCASAPVTGGCAATVAVHSCAAICTGRLASTLVTAQYAATYQVATQVPALRHSQLINAEGQSHYSVHAWGRRPATNFRAALACKTPASVSGASKLRNVIQVSGCTSRVIAWSQVVDVARSAHERVLEVRAAVRRLRKKDVHHLRQSAHLRACQACFCSPCCTLC